MGLLIFNKHNDNSSKFDVELTKEVTVQELVDYITSVYDFNWGWIAFEDGNIYAKRDCVEYAYGNITHNYLSPFMNEKKVLQGTASSVWDCMDYNFILEK